MTARTPDAATATSDAAAIARSPPRRHRPGRHRRDGLGDTNKKAQHAGG